MPDSFVAPTGALTRWVAGLIVPILASAFLILYLSPETSGARFAWQIKPGLTAMYIGAGYLGGAWLLLRAAMGGSWHSFAAGFAAIAAFTLAMLLVTVLHWDRFEKGHLPFQLWLVLYAVTPGLMTWLWWRESARARRAGPPPADTAQVPAAFRAGAFALGAGMLVLSLAGLAAPALLQAIWTWELSPLTARVMAGWGLIMGVGTVLAARHSGWLFWRVGLEAIFLWQALFLLAAVLRRQDFHNGQWLNWHTAGITAVLVAMAWLHQRMQSQGRRTIADPSRA